MGGETSTTSQLFSYAGSQQAHSCIFCYRRASPKGSGSAVKAAARCRRSNEARTSTKPSSHDGAMICEAARAEPGAGIYMSRHRPEMYSGVVSPAATGPVAVAANDDIAKAGLEVTAMSPNGSTPGSGPTDSIGVSLGTDPAMQRSMSSRSPSRRSRADNTYSCCRATSSATGSAPEASQSANNLVVRKSELVAIAINFPAVALPTAVNSCDAATGRARRASCDPSSATRINSEAMHRFQQDVSTPCKWPGPIPCSTRVSEVRESVVENAHTWRPLHTLHG